MNVKFDSIDENIYFKEVIEGNVSPNKEKAINKIVIGKLNRRSKSEYQNIEVNINNLNMLNDIDIYIHQLKNEGLHDNKISLLHILSYLNAKGFDKAINVFIISNDYNYYYKEYFSTIYCDTDFQSSFKPNTLKIALVILIKKYFGFRLTHFLKIIYHKIRRFLRR